jgi:CBS domain-containing protein
VLEEVCERIAASPVDASDVEVQVDEGAVTLTGRVASKHDRRFIEDLAEDVFGVNEVRNALRVARIREEVGRGGARAAAPSGRAALRCEDLMKRDPICCQENDAIQAVASKMQASNVGFMPICGPDGKPIGTVTDRDLAIRAVAAGKGPQTQVGEVMSREVISCAPSDELREAEQKMRDHHKARIMVCDRDGKLVGIISLSDILEHEESGAAAETAREIAMREAHS